MLFAHLDRAERTVPLAALARSGDRLHILYHNIAERENRLQVSDYSGFGFPSTTGRGGYSLLPLESILKAFRPSPLSQSSRPSHGPSRLHRIFHMRGCLHHQVQDRLLGANDAQPLKLGARINTSHQRLIVRFLFVAQLYVEQAQLVPLWPCLPTFEQVTGRCRCAGHERDAPRVYHWYSHKDFLPPCQARVI